jgi:O-antigen ligase
MRFYNLYKRKYHFSLNFYSLFLLVTFIPDIMGLPPSLITYGFWALKAVTAFWLITRHQKKIYDLRWEEKLFFFVAAIYFLNIFIDVFWQNYPTGIGSPVDLIGFFLSILIALSFRYDSAFCSDSSYYFFLATLSLGLAIAFFLAEQAPLPLIGRYDANSTVNTINYGQMGCAMSIVALYGFFNRPFKYSKIVYPILFLLGIVSIMKAGSRSPVVVLLAVGVFYFFAKSGLAKGLLAVGCSAVALYFSIGLLIELSEAVGSGIASRLLSAVESGETSGRDVIYVNAIGHFKDSPLFGDFYLIPSGVGKGGYPHNFFLEAFMTTGLIGGIPFLIMVLLALRKSFGLLRHRHKSGWIILLFVQMIVYGMFSSSLYSSQDFWALCFFLLSMRPVYDGRNRISNRYGSTKRFGPKLKGGTSAPL